MWRRRGDYLRHDGVTLYRGASARWPLALVRGVVVARGNLGLESLRLVVDDDSEVTRELVKLYMLEDPHEVVRDGGMFAVARVGGVMRPATVHCRARDRAGGATGPRSSKAQARRCGKEG